MAEKIRILKQYIVQPDLLSVMIICMTPLALVCIMASLARYATK